MRASVMLKWGVEELLRKYPELRLQRAASGDTTIAGSLEFSAQSRGQKLVSDRYEISISVPPHFPRSIPMVRETARRIPPDFHKLDSDHLCLGSPTRLRHREPLFPRTRYQPYDLARQAQSCDRKGLPKPQTEKGAVFSAVC